MPLAALAVLAVGPRAASADWRWSVTPYMWATEIGLDASINDHEVLEREVDFGDVMDSLDFTLQVHFEGQQGVHGLMFDLFYADLGDDDRTISIPGSGPGEAGQVVMKGDLEMTILEAGGIYNPRGDGTGFALLYGVRVIDIDEEIDARFHFPGPLPDRNRRYEASTTLFDGLVGARFVQPFADRWSFVGRIDASTGGSELTWNTWLGVGYSFGANERFTAFGGYRYMEIEFEEDDAQAELELQNKLGGFIAGLRIAL
jgi:hypothetical protein